MSKPKITLEIVDKLGKYNCHRCHKIGEKFDFDLDRGKICPMALHSGFPYIDILRYNGHLPTTSNGDYRFCCPDSDVAMVFKIIVEEKEQI